MNILFFHRTLQKEIMDVDCKGLCQVRFGNTFSRTLPRLNASSAQLCRGKSGLEFCGKEHRVTMNAKSQSNRKLCCQAVIVLLVYSM